MDALAVEVRENPTLLGKPVVVGADPKGGKGRGVVSTASYEARKFGVHPALPIGEAFRRCPQAVFLKPNGKLYGAVAEKIFRIFERYTPLVRKTMLGLAQNVARRLRAEGLAGRTVHLKLRYAGFETLTRDATLPHPTHTTEDTFQKAWALFEKIYQRGKAVRLIGVGLAGPASHARVNLDEVEEQLGLVFPKDEDEEEEYESLGGYVAARLGHVPKKGETLDVDGARLTVEDATPKRVLRVRIEKAAPPKNSSQKSASA